MFKVVEGNILAAFQEASQYDLLTNTELRVVFPRWPSIAWLQSRLITNDKLLDPVLFFASVVELSQLVVQRDVLCSLSHTTYPL